MSGEEKFWVFGLNSIVGCTIFLRGDGHRWEEEKDLRLALTFLLFLECEVRISD